MRSLKTVRADISKIQNQIVKVNASLPPMEELISSLREQLTLAKAKSDAFLEQAAQAVACDTSVELFHDHRPETKAELAVGMQVAALGVEKMIIDLITRSEPLQNPNTLRLSNADKEKELLELRVSLYTLELEEQESLNGESNRLDVHPGAVLGIPLEFINDHSFYNFGG